MSEPYEVAVLFGSLRQESHNRMLANSLAQIALQRLSLQIVEIGALCLYNQDLEDDTPVAWKTVRHDASAMDAVLVVTPEYNRSIPAVLKNAVDVVSRPHRASALLGKPAAVVTSSPGGMDGFGANHHLRQSLGCIGVNVMAMPEASVGGMAGLIDQQGVLINSGTSQRSVRFSPRSNCRRADSISVICASTQSQIPQILSSRLRPSGVN
ncbi:hypothetical protein LMG28727_06390 [Paraburkholderia kirstenboschensis]|nr:hypothetical protein LMG28727_06390 [Paraburkholderia kirstenboschensis]